MLQLLRCCLDRQWHKPEPSSSAVENNSRRKRKKKKKKSLVPLKEGACKLKFSLKLHSSAGSALALERGRACGLLGERYSGRKSRKGRGGGGDVKRRKERCRINISQLISNQGQDGRGWKTCSEGLNGGFLFFSYAMKGTSICKSLQPLPDMLKAVYTEQETLRAPQVWDPTSTSCADDQPDFQRVWSTTISVGVRAN